MKESKNKGGGKDLRTIIKVKIKKKRKNEIKNKEKLEVEKK